MAPHHFKWSLTAALTACFCGARGLWIATEGQEARLGAYVPLVCPLLHFFNIRCPTCGFGRSTFLAFNGEIARAFDFHFLGPLLLTVMVTATVLAWTNPALLTRLTVFVYRTLRRRLVTWSLITSYCLYGFLRS